MVHRQQQQQQQSRRPTPPGTGKTKKKKKENINQSIRERKYTSATTAAIRHTKTTTTTTTLGLNTRRRRKQTKKYGSMGAATLEEEGHRRSAGARSGVVAAASLSTQDALKKEAADTAVSFVKSGDVVGLGTGSTAAFAVSRLGELLASGELENVIGVPTSKATHEQATSLGIPLSTLDEHPVLDIAIDGADEVVLGSLALVKGRGGALLREKMVEKAARRFVVVVDESKIVDGVGGSKLAMPVEVVQFCSGHLLDKIKNLKSVRGAGAEIRPKAKGSDEPYVTDNGNFIVDLFFDEAVSDAAAMATEIESVTGVVEHGLFLDMATECVVAGEKGVKLFTRD